MLRVNIRGYCKLIPINYSKLKPNTKVVQQAVKQESSSQTSVAEIDVNTVALLERLSLVDYKEQILPILRNSIEFADRIKSINTDGIEPLYTVLEDQNLYFREDHVTDGNCRAEILRNAKLTTEDYFVSPPGNIPLKQEPAK